MDWAIIFKLSDKFKIGDEVWITDELDIVNNCLGTIIGIHNEGNTIEVKTESPPGNWLLKPEQLSLEIQYGVPI